VNRFSAFYLSIVEHNVDGRDAYRVIAERINSNNGKRVSRNMVVAVRYSRTASGRRISRDYARTLNRLVEKAQRPLSAMSDREPSEWGEGEVVGFCRSIESTFLIVLRE